MGGEEEKEKERDEGFKGRRGVWLCLSGEGTPSKERRRVRQPGRHKIE